MAGHNLIKMTELAKLFIDQGFGDAKTYIQSGNVIFSNDREESSSSLSEKLEKAILKKFNLPISVVTRKNSDLVKLIDSNPYLIEPDFDASRMAVMFINKTPLDSQIQKVAGLNFPPDKFKIIGNEIFIYCPNGFARTKLNTGFFERKMNVIGTARNWKTITTILNLTDKYM
jgi:uncharacterized protein (DUF1697 family)